MRSLFVVATSLIVSIFCLSPFLSPRVLAAEVFDKKSLDARLPGGAEHTVEFVRVSDGRVLWEKNPEELLSPASVTKLLTSAAVLAKYGPAFTLKTRLWHTGTRQGSSVAGDLFVVGDGDPFFVSEKLWQMAADLRAMGYREFTGDLVIVESLFGDPARDASRREGTRASDNAYDAPVSALAVNFNTVAVVIAPGSKVGDPALVSIDPWDIAGVKIDNKARTVAGAGDPQVQVTRIGAGASPSLQISGSVPVGGPIKKVYRSVSDHVGISGEYLRSFLSGAGISVRGKVRAGSLPPQAKEILAVDSYEMRRIVQGLNVFSNNFIADTLVKRLGASFNPTGKADSPGSGTLANGIAVINDFLRNEIGIKSNFVLLNGSGLATGNRLSARDVNRLLTAMEQRMDVWPEFLASLPAYGWDGTVKKRGRRGSALLEGQIRAKTGTLSEPVSVAGLSGFFRHPSHGLVAFTILSNGKGGAKQASVSELREAQDAVLTQILSQR
jgi:D-alanyl-D-alanine carboxypeptidase/D-alanyl-D-alanine-endopeptidase (penicillin-binding protein 4)